MSPPKKRRAKGANLPSWWLDKVRAIADERKDTLDESLGQLAEILTDAVKRPSPWDHSAVSRFLREEILTVPMAEAFAIAFGIPRPFYEPRSFDEALAMQQVARRYDGKLEQITPEQRRRLATTDQVMEVAEQDAPGTKDQRAGVDSSDERASRRRRTGRATRGRSSAS